jgi:HEAT repeat protein
MKAKNKPLKASSSLLSRKKFPGKNWFPQVVRFLACAAVVSHLCFAAGPKDARETIQELMTLPETHLSVEAWRAISPNAPAIIISIFKEEKSLEKKVRLINALSNYDDPGATDFLKDQAMNNRQLEIKRASIRSIAISQGLNQKNFLEKFLKNPDAETRYETAKAFQSMHDVDAERILNEYLKREKTGWIVKRIKSEN